MPRLGLRVTVGVLLAALAAGCLGGQTGQPGSARCSSTPLSDTSAWNGTTVQQTIHAFEGTYSAGLRWQVEPRSSRLHTAVELQDSAQLSLAYEGGAAEQDCTDQLRVRMSVTLTTENSGLADTGEATIVVGRASQGLVATLHYEGQLVTLDATLPEVASGAPVMASFDARDPELPGASATFTEEPP